jgi:hypothetical protein
MTERPVRPLMLLTEHGSSFLRATLSGDTRRRSLVLLRSAAQLLPLEPGEAATVAADLGGVIEQGLS